MSQRTTIEDAKSPMLECELPRGFLLETDAGVFVLNRATIREMTGKEEDILANEKVPLTKRMQQIVGSSLISLSDDEGHSITDPAKLEGAPPMLLVSDIITVVFRIREVTVGSEVRQKVTCPECTDDEGRPNSWTAILNLSEFKSQPVNGDPRMAVRSFTTSRGNTVTWEMLTGAAQLAIERIHNPKQRATQALLARVRTLNDKPVDKEALIGLPSVERHEIRRQFDQEGGIETSFDCTCGNCGHEFKAELEIGGLRFFDPSETSND